MYPMPPAHKDTISTWACGAMGEHQQCLGILRFQGLACECWCHQRPTESSKIESLRAKLEAVKAIHAPTIEHASRTVERSCIECTDPDGIGPVPWPCATYTAAGGE